MEVYDPATDSWGAKNPMPTILFGAAAAASGKGKIYTLGGFLSGNVVQEYDPMADSWTLRRPMPTPRYGLAAVALDGKIYAIGGNGPSSAVEVYDPATDSWSRRAPMPTARVFLAAAEAGGKIYALGGSPDCCGNSRTDAVEVYDPATDRWATAAHLPVALQLSAAAGANGRIYTFGGFIPGSGAQGSTFEYTPLLGTWVERAAMPTPRDQAPAVLVDQTVFVLGGSVDCHCRALGGIGGYTLPGAHLADLEIKLTPPDPVNACQPVTYHIAVTNNGPDAASGALVKDLFPSELREITWTCSRHSAGAHCTLSSGGFTDRVADRVDLPAGGSVTYDVSAKLDPAATGVVIDTATVAPPDGVTDPVPDNNSKTVSRAIASCGIIAITKTADRPTATPTFDLGFTIEVTNRALTEIPIALTDDLTAGGLTGTSWCQDAGCPSFVPADRIDTVTSVPAGGSATFRVVGTVPCSATQITNTACATGPDRIPLCASSSVPVAPDTADLEIQLGAPAAATAGGTPARFQLEVVNNGPCVARQVALSATLPGSVVMPAHAASPRGGVSPAPNCLVPRCTASVSDAKPKGTVLTCFVGRLVVKACASIDIDVGVPCDYPPGPAPSSATVTSPTPDPAQNMNSPDRTQDGTTRIDVQADYSIKKTADRQVAQVGSSITYTIVVTNGGPSCPPGIPVRDAFPAELFGVLWCQVPGCSPLNSGDLAAVLGLQPQQSETFLASATISLAPPGSRLCNTATVSPSPGVDPRLDNNSAAACISVPPPVPTGCSNCPIPTLSPVALALLAFLLSALGVALLRR